MSVGIEVGNFWYEVGRGDYFESFFSTVCFYLEDKKWGSKYPVLMRKLYLGPIDFKEAKYALAELLDVKEKFSCLKKDEHSIIWDIRDMSKKVPKWALNPNEKVLSLSNYFVTNDGCDLIARIIDALTEAIESKNKAMIKRLDDASTMYF